MAAVDSSLYVLAVVASLFVLLICLYITAQSFAKEPGETLLRLRDARRFLIAPFLSTQVLVSD